MLYMLCSLLQYVNLLPLRPVTCYCIGVVSKATHQFYLIQT